MNRFPYCIIHLFASLILLSSVAFASTDPNLVGWWRFDEKTGDIAYESTGNANTATLLNGTTFQTGLFGNALSLDGYDQTAYIPHSDTIKPDKQITICIWVKFNALDRYCYFYDKSDGGGVQSLTIGGSPGEYYLQGALQTSSEKCVIRSSITDTEFLDDNWHLLALTYDGQDLKLYKNGLEVVSKYSPGKILTYGKANIYLGSIGNYSTEVARFNGLMDDLRIYSRALSADELAIIAGQSPAPADPPAPAIDNDDPNLLGFWKLDEQFGSSAYDSSGNDKTAALIGTPWHVTGLIDDCLSFSGTGDFLQVQDESHFDITEQITLSCWAKLAKDEQSPITFLSKANAFCLYRESYAENIIFLCDGMGRPLSSYPININDGQWHHIAATYDGSYRKIYFDGILNRQAAASGPLSTNDYNVHIAANPQYTNSDFNGKIDNVRVYDRALSEEEIKTLAALNFSTAANPAPYDNQTFVSLDTELTFTPGLYASTHDIYFGTDFDDVNDATTTSPQYQTSTTLTTFTPPALEKNKIYYWRVDEVNDTEIYKGRTWKFTTTDTPFDSSLIARWKFDESSGTDALDSSGHNNHATIYGDCEWRTSTPGTCINTTGGDDNAIIAKNESQFDITDQITIAFWMVKKDWNQWGTGDTIISKGDEAWYISRDGGWSLESNIRVHLEGVGDLRSTGDHAIADGKWHHIAATYDGSTMQLYVDGKDDNTLSTSGQIATTDFPLHFGVVADDYSHPCTSLSLKDARIYSRALTTEEIKDMSTFQWATSPTPATQTKVSQSQLNLQWTSAYSIDSSTLYLSDNYQQVCYAKPDSNSLLAVLPADCNNYTVTDLLPATTYYWRVDSHRNGQTFKGDLWSFYVTYPQGDLDADIDRDGKVNLNDFSAIADTWPPEQTPQSLNTMTVSSTMTDTNKISLSLENIYTDITKDPQGNAVFDCKTKVYSLSTPAEPAIPWKVTTILLAPDADLATLKTTTDIQYKLNADTFNVTPEPALLTWIDGKKVITDGKDTAIYTQNSFWPTEDIRILDIGQLRKYKLAKIAVPMVKYNPITKQLKQLARADIDVTFDKIANMQTSSVTLPDNIGKQRVRQLVANFDQFKASYKVNQLTTSDSNSADPNQTTYCIITTNQIVDCSQKLEDFITHKESRGFRVMTVTEDQYGDGLAGREKMLAIRAWLAANYLTENIEYVLLIGNPRISSSKFAIPMMGGDGGDQDKKPTDFMYADLTGDWDINDDDRYATYQGAAHDFQPGGVDCYSEVTVGRIPFYGVFEDLDHVLAKTIKYETAAPQDIQWRKSVLAAMEPLNDTIGISAIWGEALRNEIFEPNNWSFTGIYDPDFIPQGASAELMPCSHYNVTDTWTKGKFGAMVYCSHGSTTNAGDVVNTNLQSDMNDEYPSAVFAVSCNNANPDNQRNIAFSTLINGASCVIAATSYCYSTSDLTNFNNTGSANGQGYEYYSRVVAGKPVGVALYELKAQQGKDTHIFRWFNNMVMNLYGDPSLIIMPNPPADLNKDNNIGYEDLAILADQWLNDHN